LFSIALVGAVYLILYYYSQTLINDFIAELPPASNFIEVDGYRIHYIKKGSGPQMVLLHGTRDNYCEFSTSFVDTLSKSFEVFLIDRPGYGYSDKPESALNLQTNSILLKQILSELKIDRPVILGSSYGSSIAIKYASDYPESISGLILIKPELLPDENSRHPLSGLYNLPLLDDIMLNALYVPHSQLIDRLEEKREKDSGVRYRRTMDEFSCLPSEYKISAQELDHLENDKRLIYSSAKKVTTPALVIFNSYEKLEKGREILKYMKSSSYMVYENGINYSNVITDIKYFINNSRQTAVLKVGY
jgi:pimeloyl-ACP methyl ester carboxylesterase